jgi:L-ribulose-5-phosphate 3-epimerase
MMLKAINAWSFPGGLEGTLDPMEALRLAKQYGFEAIELCIGQQGALSLDSSEHECRALAAEASHLGIAIPSVASGLYWTRSLGDRDPAARERARHDIEVMTQIAHWLGAQTLLTIPGSVDVFFLPERAAQPYEEVWDYASQGIREVLPIAERLGVRLGVENVWNRFLLSPREMATFIDQFGSPWVGAYVDVANLMPFGYPQDWLRTLGRRVVGVHFKDFRRAVGTVEGFVDLLEGDVPWPEVVSALREIGYTGAVAAELIPCYANSPLVRVANTSRAMDAILARD